MFRFRVVQALSAQTEHPLTHNSAGEGMLSCAPEGIRTPNLLIRSQMLYPLSYGR